MKKKKIILFGSAAIVLVPILAIALNSNFFTDIMTIFSGDKQKNTQMPKEMQEIKVELKNINTNVDKDMAEIEKNTKKQSDIPLDEKIKKMDEKISVINKQEGIDTKAIENDIKAELKTPIKDEETIRKLKEIDQIMLKVEKNMNNLNIKGEQDD